MQDTADASNMINVLRSFPDMIKEGIELGDDITFQKEFIENIAVCGMGGSGFTGDLLKVYLDKYPFPIHVIKDYNLPPYLQRKTLVFAISYSGNTEETVSAYRSAVRRGCKIVTISSGGKLEELAKMNKTLHIKIPKGIQPRISVPYLFIPVLNSLSYSGIIDDQEASLKKLFSGMKANSQAIEAKAKEIAAKLKDKIPIIYSSQRMFCIAEKWKTDINENAKAHAFYNMFPEFNHNEICAYENQKMQSHIIILSDKEDYDKIKERIKVFKKVVAQYKAETTEIAITGEEFLTRLFSGIWMGLYVGYFLALEYGTDPTPVKIIEKFKKDLS